MNNRCRNGVNQRAGNSAFVLNLVLLGAPGSGKGTQAEHLAEEFGLCHIASGDLFREHLKNGTRLGEMARAYMNRGELAPDDITDAMIEKRLTRLGPHEGFVLDGFPRTVQQATALAKVLRKLHRPLDAVISIRVPDDALVERLSGRLVCSVCETPYHMKYHPPKNSGICDKCGGKLYEREDDRPETVRARLKTYHTRTEPLIELYRREGLLLPIDGQGDIGAVAKIASTAIRELSHRALIRAVN